jgi:hypothetical protein
MAGKLKTKREIPSPMKKLKFPGILKRKTCGGAEKNNGRAGAVCCAVSK